MKELQEIWDNLREKPIDEDHVATIVSRKSIYELERFRKILMIELYASALVFILFLPVIAFIRIELSFIVLFTVVITTLLNVYTLHRLKKINLQRDVKTFLKSAIRFLKTFILQFFLSIQGVGLVMLFVLKSFMFPSQSWSTWLLSAPGIFSVSLLATVEFFLIVYAWFFYFKRISSLHNLLKDFGE